MDAGTFTTGVTGCMNGSFEFPGLDEPGFPNFLAAFFASLLGGVDYVLGFIPPSPSNVPSIPSLQTFIDPFMANLNIPSANIPEIEIAPGFTLPAVGDPNGASAFDLSGLVKLLKLLILLPFELIKGIVESIINLSLALPTFEMIVDILKSLAASVGLDVNAEAIVKLASCLPLAIFNMLTELIPV